MDANVVQALAALVTVLVTSMGLWHLVWRPYAIARWYERLGIRGPPYRFVVGSLLEYRRLMVAGRAKALDAGCHNYISLVCPFVQKWTSDYGKTFLLWLGPTPTICSTDMEVVKQVLTDRADLFRHDYLSPSLDIVADKGLLFANGDDWKRHRKVVNPIFNHDKLKSMSAMASQGTRKLMEQWSAQIRKGDGHQAETDARQDFQELTTVVIAQVIFGRDYMEAREVLTACKELTELAIRAFAEPPGFSYLPTRRNRRSWKLDKSMRSKIMQLIEARLASDDYGDDLLGLMLQACKSDADILSTDEIIGECKAIFSAGQDTTNKLLTWGMFLLSSYPPWQEKIREEVLRECPDDGRTPTFKELGKLKLLHMFLLETLRLYAPSVFLFPRKTAADTMLRNIKVLKGTTIFIPVLMLHRDKELWGPDADEFNPVRFDEGVYRATETPHAFLAFSYGPKVCPGQNLAMIKVQTVMAMILRRFSFSLSPNYVHKPTNFVTLVPKYGLPLIVHHLHQNDVSGR